MGFFSGSDKKAMRKAVMVTVGNGSLRLIGFVTRENFHDLPAGIGGDDTVAVYLPMTIEDAMRFAVTAGMSEMKEQ